MKKLGSLMVAFLFVFVTMLSTVACSQNNSNSNKTILNVYSYGGGFGTEWLDSLEKRFERDFAEHKFEDDKVGIDIVTSNSKTNGMDEVNAAIGSGIDVYFCQEINYYDAAVVKGAFLDITDIVEEKLTDYGENKSIRDKFTAEQDTYLKINGRYYGIPHYMSNMGITYDVQFFEENNLYFAQNGEFISSFTDARSAGPDGDLTTAYDNGLPATYDEFFKLCAKISTIGDSIPVYMMDSADGYLHQFICSLYADYEGVDQMLLNYNFNGTANNIVKNYSVDGYGKVTNIEFITDATETQITNATGYKLFNQAGRLYALSFLERLKSGGYIYFGEDEGHLEAQYSFLEKGVTNVGRAAMYIDGNYWIEEAKTSNTFETLVDEYGARAELENRRLAYMPLPKADVSKLGKATMFDLLYSMSFINSSIPANKIEAAKTFLQYANTDESLTDYTVITGTTKSLIYDIGDAYREMSFYGKSLWDFVNNSNVVYPYSQNNLYLANQSTFMMFWPRMWTANIGGKTTESVASKITSGELTAKEVFDGLADYYTQSYWAASYASYIN